MCSVKASTTIITGEYMYMCSGRYMKDSINNSSNPDSVQFGASTTLAARTRLRKVHQAVRAVNDYVARFDRRTTKQLTTALEKVATPEINTVKPDVVLEAVKPLLVEKRFKNLDSRPQKKTQTDSERTLQPIVAGQRAVVDDVKKIIAEVSPSVTGQGQHHATQEIKAVSSDVQQSNKLARRYVASPLTQATATIEDIENYMRLLNESKPEVVAAIAQKIQHEQSALVHPDTPEASGADLPIAITSENFALEKDSEGGRREQSASDTSKQGQSGNMVLDSDSKDGDARTRQERARLKALDSALTSREILKTLGTL